MLDHVSIQVRDVAAATSFYDAVFAPLGYRRVMDFGDAVGYGDDFPAFWVGLAEAEGPGLPPHANYFGGFVRDPDGNNVEACCHRPE